ncbi:hypothetical protein NDU88_000377 [Pleurodeles waltl]|uniref:Uncharacterized protein n=1 Tax=Pleurodeles waltl TaxID=8319 RepID=A0AAV7S9W5_PLEWA|nr:hypothetical protein NDU88_000377 [Pleurodeles waltl]
MATPGPPPLVSPQQAASSHRRGAPLGRRVSRADNRVIPWDLHVRAPRTIPKDTRYVHLLSCSKQSSLLRSAWPLTGSPATSAAHHSCPRAARRHRKADERHRGRPQSSTEDCSRTPLHCVRASLPAQNFFSLPWVCDGTSNALGPAFGYTCFTRVRS